ncbi:MAG: hypothetical protein A2341_06220, partial [Deltaproteobacteria bacterium RIFOXYB12_FULL_58_9]
MQRISSFFGIVITMYFDDHAPPHFHATYGEESAVFAIETLEMLNGKMNRRAAAMVLEWASAHRRELGEDWDRCRQGLLAPGPIDPLHIVARSYSWLESSMSKSFAISPWSFRLRMARSGKLT